jgi:hypothetical protein
MLYSGVHLHRRSIIICTENEGGTVPAHHKSTYTQSKLINNYFRLWPDQHRGLVECTTGLDWFSDILRSLRVDVVLAHAKDLKMIC